MISEDLDIRWCAFAKMHNMDHEFIDLAKESGCHTIFWGIEHFSPKMIKIFNKRYNGDQVKDIINYSNKKAIINHISLIGLSKSSNYAL